MGLNKLFLTSTDLFCKLSSIYRIKPYFRQLNDVRLVFYHGIGDSVDPCFKYLYDEISSNAFQRQIRYLNEKYNLVSLDNAIYYIENTNLKTIRPMSSISFDDGLRSVYLNAYPILKERKIPATVFVNTAVIGNNNMTDLHLLSYLLVRYGGKTIQSYIIRLNNDGPLPPSNPFDIQSWYISNYDQNFDLLEKICAELCIDVGEIAQKERIYLHWDEIEEMSKNGFMFCSHTHNHRPLALLAVNEINREISMAYNIIKSHYYNTDFVSFPFGMKVLYGTKSIKCAKELGHKYIVEVGDGVNIPNAFVLDKVLSRVCLGLINCNDAEMYSAIEMRPLVKNKLKSIVK